jgi:hypothetical protein
MLTDVCRGYFTALGKKGSTCQKSWSGLLTAMCIHCGVEVTELSTNKQHTLSRCCQCAGARAESRACVGRAQAACDLAATRLTSAPDEMTGSIDVDIAGVDAEVCRLRTDLHSTKEDLQRTYTELAAVQAESNLFSLALTGVKQDHDSEGLTCKTLEAEVKKLCSQLRAAYEDQLVPEVVSCASNCCPMAD